jgi:hypothetical protein
LRTRLVFLITAVASFAALAGTASAATVTYTNNTPLAVPDNTGLNGIDTLVTVPAGRTPVQSIQMTGVRPSFPAGGADVSYKLKAPNGTEMFPMLTGCSVFPNTTSFAIRDGAALEVGTFNFCNTQLNGGEGDPNDPNGKTFADFVGTPTPGNWIFNVRDLGLNATQGFLNGWSIQITHQPFVATVTAKKQRLRKRVTFTAECNADCTVSKGADVKGQPDSLNQGNAEVLSAKLKPKARKRLADKGKAKLKLVFDDGYGDTYTKTMRVKFRR